MSIKGNYQYQFLKVLLFLGILPSLQAAIPIFNPTLIPIPTSITNLYQIKEFDLINYYELNLGEDNKKNSIWLIQDSQKNYQILCWNKKNKTIQHILKGDWNKRIPPTLVWESLNQSKEKYLFIYDIKKNFTLKEILSFNDWKIKTIFNANDNLLKEIFPDRYKNFKLINAQLSQENKKTLLLTQHKHQLNPKVPLFKTKWQITPFGIQIFSKEF